MGAGVVLMFSGGRDSTLAALRLAKSGTERLVLVTVTSDHLVGIDAVTERLEELRPLLSGTDASWLHVRQPRVSSDRLLSPRTCLPCHTAYSVTGVSIARTSSVQGLAFGYATYQSDWPEQTPAAVMALRRVLAEHEIDLHVPVYDVLTKHAAIDELREAGLSVAALEQKCLQQVSNVTLSQPALERELGHWEAALRQTIADVAAQPLEILNQRVLSGRAG